MGGARRGSLDCSLLTELLLRRPRRGFHFVGNRPGTENGTGTCAGVHGTGGSARGLEWRLDPIPDSGD